MNHLDFMHQQIFEMIEKMVSDRPTQTPAMTLQQFLDEEPEWFKDSVNSLPSAGDVYDDIMARFARIVITNNIDSYFGT